jgi:hypothetical protein
MSFMPKNVRPRFRPPRNSASHAALDNLGPHMYAFVNAGDRIEVLIDAKALKKQCRPVYAPVVYQMMYSG